MEDSLTSLVDMYQEALRSSSTERSNATKCRLYFEHEHWSGSERAELAKRKQHPSTVNYTHKNVNFLIGQEQQSRQNPKAYPRTPAHEDAAHAASDAIKYVCDNAEFDTIASDCYENLLIEASCGSVVEVEHNKKKDDYEVTITRVPADRIFRDPYSREKDYSDANYLGYEQWLDYEVAKEKALAAGFSGELMEDDSDFEEGSEDKPAHNQWSDRKRKRVKFAYLWFKKKGVWMYAVFTKSTLIWGPEPCPYVDEDGEPECNFIIQSMLVDSENNRYSYAYGLLNQQDAINKRESKVMHLFSQRQTWSRDNAFKNPNKAKNELAKPDGHLEVNGSATMGEDFGILPTGDMASGMFTLLQEAKNQMDLIAATAQASEQGDQSGRAIDALAQRSKTGTNIYSDAHKKWKIRVYRSIWLKIRQYWEQEKWLRVTDDEDNLKWVGLNAKVSRAEQMIMDQTQEKLSDVRKKYSIEIQQAIAQNPELGQAVAIENAVADLDVDIILDESPNSLTWQHEQFLTIASLAERRNDIPTSLIIKMSDLRNKDQIIDEMNGGQEQRQAQAQQHAAMAELEARASNADISEKEAKALKTQAEAEQKQIENQLLMLRPIEPTVVI